MIDYEVKRMKKNRFLSELEKCSPWIGINRKLAGPVLIISIIYILIYLVILIYFWSDLLKLNWLLHGLCFVGFAIFLLAIYFAFTGFLLRGRNKMDDNG